MNWLKYKKIYLSLSLALILASIFGLSFWGLNRGVDFTGGSQIEYKFDETVDQENLSKIVTEVGIDVSSIQTIGENTYLIKTKEIDTEKKDILTQALVDKTATGVTFNRFESVGPSIGDELVKKTFYAAGIASILILFWVAYQFKSFTFGLSAVLAMFHDTFILIGSFSFFGYFFGAEVDFLVVTAILTTLSFSVHDTIVVFDRIREIHARDTSSLEDVANRALTETMVRSLNNSFTIIFMLTALILLGGVTIKWFAVALLIGTVLGTYSSPFVAVPILIAADKVFRRVKK